MEAELFSTINYKAVPVIFLDRDGVINAKAAPHEYITKWEDFRILPGVYEALKMFNIMGLKIFIVTNQRCIARKIAVSEEISKIHERMLEDFSAHDCKVDGVFVCPHDDEDNCDCRKPKPGLLFQAQKFLEDNLGVTVDKKISWIIGDSDTDIQAGKSYGINTMLINSMNKNILYVAKKILNLNIDIEREILS